MVEFPLSPNSWGSSHLRYGRRSAMFDTFLTVFRNLFAAAITWGASSCTTAVAGFRRKLSIPALGRELNKGPMQRTSGGLNHFGIVVLVCAQMNRHLELTAPRSI
jgi:hypothetical protein